MPGNVVPLYLCKTCKGLFVFESQAENHEVKCNGDAFKSPANLFVCEREHYLELIAPTPSVSVSGTKGKGKGSKSRLLCERKRRKTSPQISITSENRVTRRSFLSKDDLSTLTPGTYYGMVSPQMWDTEGKTVARPTVSHSQPHPQAKLTSQQNSVNSILYAGNTGSKTVQCTSQQNVLNAVVSLAPPVSQSFILTGNANGMPCCFSPTKTEVSFSSSSSLQPADHEELGSADSDSVLLQKNSTPATNLLAYLSQLQQGTECTVTQSTIQTVEEDHFPSLVHHTTSVDKPSDLFAVLDSKPVERTSVLTSSSVQSSLPVTSDQNQHVDILTVAGDILEFDDFQFKEIGSIDSGNVVHSTSQLLDDTVDAQAIHEFLTFGSGVSGDCTKQSEINNSLDTPTYQVDTGGHSFSNPASSNCNRNLQLKQDGDQHMSRFDSTDTVQPFQTECSTSTAVSVFEKAEMNHVNRVPSSQGGNIQGNNMQGPVVLFLNDGNIIQSMAVENTLNSSTEDSSSMAVTSRMSTQDILKQCTPSSMQVQVCESAVQGGTNSLNSCQMTVASVSKPSMKPDYVTVTGTSGTGRDTSSITRSGKGITKAKSKYQIRLEELSVLREEVLLQATEILVDAEAKKFHYNCNVCGHMAKSVKFMHNHLQMHADGKVYFECDQCDFKSRVRSKLVEHQQRHTRSRLLCHLCPSTFMDTASLNRHVAAKHSDNEALKCDRCDFTASYASLLKEHMLKHTGDLFCCDVEGCGYKTPYQRALRVHQKRHMSEKNYRCHLCSYETVEKSTLDRHIKSHTQERPYMCSACDFRANTRFNVVTHMQHMHQPQKSFYACDKCSFSTTYASSIAKHLKTHMSTFTCPLCSHSTRTLSSVKKHLHQVHHVVHMEVVENSTRINTKDYLHTQSSHKDLMDSHKDLMDSHKDLMDSHKDLMDPNKALMGCDKAFMDSHKDLMDSAHKALMDSDKALMDPDKDLMDSDKALMDSDKALMDSDKALMDADKDLMESNKALMDSLMNVDSQDLPPLSMTDMDRSRVDPMKLSFHFQDPVPAPSCSGTNLTRSSSIPDLFTFSGMHGSNSQSDLLNFPGISAMTRSNSTSDLVTFATSVCVDGGEAVNMDISLSDASAPVMDDGGLSLGEDGDDSLSGDIITPGSPGGVLLALQCSKCLALLMNEDDVDNHKKTCKGNVLMV